MWIKLELENAVASESWDYEDSKWCWYWKLLIQQARGEGSGIPGYLPDDGDRLWRIAGAKTRWFFEKKGGREVLQRHFRSTEIGSRKLLFNPKMLEIVNLSIAKQKHTAPENEQNHFSKSQKTNGESKLDSSFFLSDVAFDVGVVLTDIDELKVVGDKVFAYYMQKFGRDKRYKFTPQRRKKFELRMCEILPDCLTLTVAAGEAMRAIDNLSRSEFHVAGGYYDWIDHIFTSREMFEKRLAMVNSNGNTKQTASQRNQQSTIEAARAVIRGYQDVDRGGTSNDGDPVGQTAERGTIEGVCRRVADSPAVEAPNRVQAAKAGMDS